MSTVQRELSVTLRTVAPDQHYSKIVKFASEVAKAVANDKPTSVEIFPESGHWYCRVRRGDEKTPPMGPYRWASEPFGEAAMPPSRVRLCFGSQAEQQPPYGSSLSSRKLDTTRRFCDLQAVSGQSRTSLSLP